MKTAVEQNESPRHTEPASQVNERAVLLLVCTCTFMAVLNNSMFNVALPSIGDDFTVGPARLGWVVTTYSLFFGLAVPFYGRLGDLRGTRRFFMLGLSIFSIASLAASLAPNFWSLIGARALQALGNAAIPALGTAVIVRTFPPNRRGMAMGYNAAVVGVGGALGPTIGGIVVQLTTWRTLFLISACVGLLVPLVRRTLPGDPPPKSGSLDLPGGLLLAGMVAALLFGVTNLGTQGIGSTTVLASFGVCLLFLALLIVRTRTAASPFLDPVLLRNRNYVMFCLLAFTVMIAYMGTIVLLPLLLDRVNDISASRIGLALLPAAATMALVAPIAGRLSDRVGILKPMRAGISMILLSVFLLSSFGAGSAPWIVAGFLMIAGAGNGLTNSTMLNGMSQVIPPERMGLGIGLFNMLFFLGGGFGAALTTAVLDSREFTPDATNPIHTGLGAGFSDAMLVPLLSISIALAISLLVRTPARLRDRH